MGRRWRRSEHLHAAGHVERLFESLECAYALAALAQKVDDELRARVRDEGGVQADVHDPRIHAEHLGESARAPLADLLVTQVNGVHARLRQPEHSR